MVQVDQNKITQDDAIMETFGFFIGGIRTACVGYVTSFDEDRQKASIQPVNIKGYIDSSKAVKEHQDPELHDVPVFFPRSGKAFVSIPIEKGTPCLLVFCERSIEQWDQSDGKTMIKLDDLRDHDVSDAIALIGLSTSKIPIKSYSKKNIVVGFDEGLQVQVSPDKMMIGNFSNGDTSTANKALALAQEIDSKLSSISSAFNTHVHPTAATGPPSLPTTSISIAGTVASTKAFVDG